MSSIITIATIGAPHGVRGWVRLLSHTDPLDNILTYNCHMALQNGHWSAIKIATIKPHKGQFIAKIIGIDTPEDARRLTHCQIGIPRAALAPAEPGHYYWADLEGLIVINENKVVLGRISHLFATGANDVMVVVNDSGKQHLLPVTKQTIEKMDQSAGEIHVRWDPDF